MKIKFYRKLIVTFAALGICSFLFVFSPLFHACKMDKARKQFSFLAKTEHWTKTLSDSPTTDLSFDIYCMEDSNRVAYHEISYIKKMLFLRYAYHDCIEFGWQKNNVNYPFYVSVCYEWDKHVFYISLKRISYYKHHCIKSTIKEQGIDDGVNYYMVDEIDSVEFYKLKEDWDFGRNINEKLKISGNENVTLYRQ